MGRTEASKGLAPPSVRKDQRAKNAKATINQVVPKILASSARARQGVASAELVVDPPKQPQLKTGKDAIERQYPGPKLQLAITDTVSAAWSLYENEDRSDATFSNGQAQSSRIGILNMASQLRPGGGLLNGAQAQEEFLCLRTTLLPSLKEEFYRLPEVGGILTKDVLVFRDGDGHDLPKAKRFFTDVVTSGMLRFPGTHVVTVDTKVGAVIDAGSNLCKVPRNNADASDNMHQAYEADPFSSNENDNDGSDAVLDQHALDAFASSSKSVYANDEDRQLVVRKMRAVLRIFEKAEVKQVILGAWGCGAYGNPVEEVAAAWKKVLLGSRGRQSETWAGFETILFAISDSRLAERFLSAFGDDLGVGSLAKETAHDVLDEPNETLNEAQELTSKLAELELQRARTRVPDLKARLGIIIQGLQEKLAQKHNNVLDK